MENVAAGFEHVVVLAAVVERAEVEVEVREVFTIGRTSGPGCAPYVASMTLSMLLGQPQSGSAATVTGDVFALFVDSVRDDNFSGGFTNSVQS